MSCIEIKDLSVIYGNQENRVNALDNISFNVETGDFVAITGKSGCGKTTLLNVLGKVINPSSGSYCFEGEDITKLSSSKSAKFRNNNIGFIVQHFALIQDINIYKNIAMPMIYKKYSFKKIRERIAYLLDALEISDKLEKYPYELSGGQCQRVAIARAIATEPKLLLADEPTGALDEKTGIVIMDILKKINESGTTVMLVTHDQDLAKACNRQIILKDGKIEV